MEKARLLVLDTETCNIEKLDKVVPGNNLTYDIGYSVVEPSTAKTLVEKSYVVQEIFFGERERMDTCYYASKLPQYYEDLTFGKRQVARFMDIIIDIRHLCAEYNVVAIVAHNARFDIDAINTTFKWLYGFYTKVLDFIEIWDSMKMAKTFTDTPSYRKYCEVNGYMTKHKPPRSRMTAEIIYRFISGDDGFIEKHTALEDTMIEREIVFRAYRTHKKMDRVLYERG